MTAVIVSETMQVTIPASVCEALELRPGLKFEVIPIDGRIELVPVGDIGDLRGFLRGIDTTVDPEDGE